MALTWTCKHHRDLTKEELYAILQLRTEVFVVEQKCPYQEVDGLDLIGDTCHLMAHEGGQLLAYLRLLDPATHDGEVVIGRVITAAAMLDVGAGQLIALQRHAIRGNVDRASVRKNPHELVVRHARPVADVAGIEMHERRARGRVEADAATLQAQAGVADLLKRHVGDVEIHRMAEHMLAEARHAGMGGAAAEHGVGFRRAIGGDDLDRLLAADVAIDFPDDIEQVGIHRSLFLGAPVTQEVVELLQGLFVKAAVALEGDGEVFAGMGVMEGERAGFVQGGRVGNGADSGEQQCRG